MTLVDSSFSITIVKTWLNAGSAAGVGVAVGVGACVGVGVGVGAGVAVGVGAGVGFGVDVGVGVGAGVRVGVGVDVGVGAGVGLAVAVGVALGLAVGCDVAAGVGCPAVLLGLTVLGRALADGVEAKDGPRATGGRGVGAMGFGPNSSDEIHMSNAAIPAHRTRRLDMSGSPRTHH